MGQKQAGERPGDEEGVEEKLAHERTPFRSRPSGRLSKRDDGPIIPNACGRTCARTRESGILGSTNAAATPDRKYLKPIARGEYATDLDVMRVLTFSVALQIEVRCRASMVFIAATRWSA
jgi:hypothetical protein